MNLAHKKSKMITLMNFRKSPLYKIKIKFYFK